MVLLAVGCEDFLKPKSENEFVPTTVQALDEMLLYETYANQRSGSIPFFDLLSDDAAVVRFSGTESNLLTQVRLASIKALFTWPDRNLSTKVIQPITRRNKSFLKNTTSTRAIFSHDNGFI